MAWYTWRCLLLISLVFGVVYSLQLLQNAENLLIFSILCLCEGVNTKQDKDRFGLYVLRIVYINDFFRIWCNILRKISSTNYRQCLYEFIKVFIYENKKSTLTSMVLLIGLGGLSRAAKLIAAGYGRYRTRTGQLLTARVWAGIKN